MARTFNAGTFSHLPTTTTSSSQPRGPSSAGSTRPEATYLGTLGGLSTSSSQRGAWRLAQARLILPVKMDRKAGGWVSAMKIWPTTTMKKAIATMSWMKVAPVRQESAKS